MIRFLTLCGCLVAACGVANVEIHNDRALSASAELVAEWSQWGIRPLHRLGDVDGNGRVDSADVALLEQHLAGRQVALACAAAADTEPDGNVTPRDLANVRSLTRAPATVLGGSTHLPCSVRMSSGIAAPTAVAVGDSVVVHAFRGGPIVRAASDLPGVAIKGVGTNQLVVQLSYEAGAAGTVTLDIETSQERFRIPIAVREGGPTVALALGSGGSGTGGGSAGTGGGSTASPLGSGAQADGGRLADGGFRTDGGFRADGGVAPDGGVALDGGAARDGGADAGDAGCGYTGCSALVVSLFTEDYGARTGPTATALRAQGCSVHEFDIYGKLPEPPVRWCFLGLFCNMSEAEYAAELQAYAAAERSLLGALLAAGADHAKDVQTGVKHALEIINAHGSPAPQVGNTCGQWSTHKAAGFTLDRSSSIQGLYDVVNGNACHWFFSDNSCSSGRSVEAFEAVNNSGAATCGRPVTHRHPLHAAIDSDIAVSASGTDTCTFNEGNAHAAQVDKVFAGPPSSWTQAASGMSWADGYSDPGKNR